MKYRTAVLLFAAFLTLPAAKKNTGTGHGENEDVAITATVYADKDAVKELLGNDLDGHYVIADVKVASRFGKEIDVNRDDFYLRTDKDGEKSAPFVGSQIAGRGALVISERASGETVMGQDNGPMWGGMPGPMGGPMGMPASGGGVGNATSGATEAEAKVNTGGKDKANPLKALLDQKILPDKKTTEALTGLLYFPLEKQKVKDLELVYKGTGGRINIRFR